MTEPPRSAAVSLPFKGRVRVGMGIDCMRFRSISLLTSPLKSEQQFS